MDLDDLCITNTNRQIHALETTIGQSKTEAMAARPPANQPGGGNHLHQQFLHGLQCQEKLLETKPDVIIDAIDSLIPKAHLIASCYRSKQPLVTCGRRGRTRQPRKNRNRRPLPH